VRRYSPSVTDASPTSSCRTHDVADRGIFGVPQTLARKLAGADNFACVEERRRTQEAPDVFGSETGGAVGRSSRPSY
jgi:hypothetical protein